MNNYRVIVALVALLGFGSAGITLASVVTDNNLGATGLGALTNTTYAQVSANVPVSPYQLIGVKSTVSVLEAGFAPMSAYHMDALSKFPTASSTNDLVTTVAYWPTSPSVGTTYNDQLVLGTGSGNPSLYYNLGVGRADGPTYGYPEGWDYRFGTPAITLYTPAGADGGLITHNGLTYGGNLVPNASFENSSINFFTGPSSYVADPGKQGSQVLEITGITASYITLPLQPGRPYAVDFWYAGIGLDKVEYGFSPIPDGTAVAAGNTGFLFLDGVETWHEVQWFFTPTDTETNLYIGGMSAGTYLRFDSFDVATVPEPSTLFLFGTGGLLLAWWRKRRGQ